MTNEISRGVAMRPYTFEILQEANRVGGAFDSAILDERPFVQRARGAPEGLSRNRREAPLYSPSPPLTVAMNTAIATGLPLLLTGEPGTGKTQAAYYIAHTLKLDI